MEVVINDTWLPIRDASCGARHTVVVACNKFLYID